MKFYCHTLETEIKKACQLKECPYNVNSPYSKNCLLPYPDDTFLSLAEVAYMYSKPIGVLRKTWGSAVEKIYGRYFKQAFKKEIPIHYVPSKKISIASETFAIKPIRLLEKYTIDESEVKYSIRVWEKAVELGVTPEKLLKTSLKLFKNNKLMDTYFKLPRGSSKRLRVELA